MEPGNIHNFLEVGIRVLANVVFRPNFVSIVLFRRILRALCSSYDGLFADASPSSSDFGSSFISTFVRLVVLLEEEVPTFRVDRLRFFVTVMDFSKKDKRSVNPFSYLRSESHRKRSILFHASVKRFLCEHEKVVILCPPILSGGGVPGVRSGPTTAWMELADQ